MSIIERTTAFCARFGLRVPILLAPMAGACPPTLSIAMMNVGSLGACGAVLMQPNEIAAWADEVRAKGNGPFQLNLWIPDPPPRRDRAHEDQVRAFLERFGPAVAANAGDATPPDFAAQCEALLAARPPIVSSVMGLYPPDFVAKLKRAGIVWFANVSTVARRAPPKTPAPTSWPCREWRQAAIGAASTRLSRNGRWSGCLRSFPPLSTRSRSPWWRPAALPMRAASPPPCCRRQRRADRQRAAALPGGEASSGLGRCARSRRPGGHDGQPRVQRPRRTQHRDQIRARRHSGGRAATGAISGPARLDGRDAHRRAANRRRRAHAAWAGQSAALARAEPAAQLVAGLGLKLSRSCADRSVI